MPKGGSTKILSLESIPHYLLSEIYSIAAYNKYDAGSLPPDVIPIMLIILFSLLLAQRILEFYAFPNELITEH